METNVSQNGREGNTLALGVLLIANRKIKSVMKGEVFWPTKGLHVTLNLPLLAFTALFIPFNGEQLSAQYGSM